MVIKFEGIQNNAIILRDDEQPENSTAVILGDLIGKSAETLDDMFAVRMRNSIAVLMRRNDRGENDSRETNVML